MEADHGGRPCSGEFKEIRNCTSRPCDGENTDCLWSKWGSWSECADRCSGNQQRSRDIAQEAHGSGRFCQGPAREMRSCEGTGDECGGAGPVSEDDCQLSPWSEWSACSKSCSGGEQTATRVVMREARPSGKPCKGSMSTMAPCNTAPCPGEEPVDCAWDNWGQWSTCPVTCNGGETKRSRGLRLEAKRGGRACNTSATIQVATCNTQPCTDPEYCVWAPWSSWDPCSVTCSGGEKKRRRSLVDYATARAAAAHGGTPPLQLKETGANAGMRDGEVAGGLLDSLVLHHRAQVCLLAMVGALSLTWMTLQGVRQGHALVQQRRSERSTLVPYVALATEDPATINEEDEDPATINERWAMMR